MLIDLPMLVFSLARYSMRQPLLMYGECAQSLSVTGFERVRIQSSTLRSMDENISALHACRGVVGISMRVASFIGRGRANSAYKKDTAISRVSYRWSYKRLAFLGDCLFWLSISSMCASGILSIFTLVHFVALLFLSQCSWHIILVPTPMRPAKHHQAPCLSARF